MKTILVISAALLSSSLNFSATASSANLSYIDQAVTAICVNTAADDRLALLNTLKSYRISKINAVSKVVCNQQALMNFARTMQAHKVERMLAPIEATLKGKVTIHDVASAS